MLFVFSCLLYVACVALLGVCCLLLLHAASSFVVCDLLFAIRCSCRVFWYLLSCGGGWLIR